VYAVCVPESVNPGPEGGFDRRRGQKYGRRQSSANPPAISHVVAGDPERRVRPDQKYGDVCATSCSALRATTSTMIRKMQQAESRSGCDAVDVQPIHAVLGASENCIATHPSDMCVALAAWMQQCTFKGPEGERAIAFNSFHCLPRQYTACGNSSQIQRTLTSVELASAAVCKAIVLSQSA